MSDVYVMSINRIDILIDKDTFVKYRTLLGVILQKDIPTKLELKFMITSLTTLFVLKTTWIVGLKFYSPV